MRGAVPRGHGIRARVGGAEHRELDGRARVKRAQLHCGARVEIVGRCEDALVIRLEQPPRFERYLLRPRSSFRRDEALHSVRDGVVPGGRRDRRRLRQRETWIEDNGAERCLRVAARHFLMRPRVRNDGVRLRFAAGARRRRHSDHRQHRLRRFAVTLKVVDHAALRQQKVDAFRAVQRAAAAEADDRVDALACRKTFAGLEHVGVRVRSEVAELDRVNARRFERRMRMLQMPGLHQAGIGDQQRAREPQLLCQRAKPIDRTVTREHAYIRRNRQSTILNLATIFQSASLPICE